MNLIMAAGAKRNQIIVRIAARPAAEANVVNLKILRRATLLASPAITRLSTCVQVRRYAAEVSRRRR